MRRSDAFLSLLAVCLTLFLLTFVDAGVRGNGAAADLTQDKVLVRELGITDLCLFTEARYTRHLTQADLHTPFQDHPFSMEHFPTGSLFPPPRLMRDPDADLYPKTEVPD